ncbi:probable phytol kinase 2, chloroplastic isoform X2 [Zingiber officinale]|uniref:probable phytol kinase 2, chloroplastic isoform X2 n=1 Tax=Zingiber officinale TaxID=94328 RepID=UPI001C4BFAC4|nr:probable phytol kinase 2, chloroplastic isoform X2 [Zingiber officinale]
MAAPVLLESSFVHDLGAAAVATAVFLLVLQFWEVLAKRGVFEQIDPVLALAACSSGTQAPFLAAFAPGINIFRMLLLGHGISKNEATVKSMSRYGDHRELLKGPLYYACTITFSTAIFWRTSPIAVAAICNLCAGDGVADIVGRRLGKAKLPHNPNKSFAGSIANFLAGFVASVGYMHYFHTFGFIEESWRMVMGFLVASLAAAFVESLPISTELDDNLTVTVASMLVGGLVF